MISIISKNKLVGIVLLILIALFFACKKETPVVITPTDPCAQNYELYSKPYVNLFKGKYNKCPIASAETFYPDKYSYYTIGSNPKNKYEICYLREENESTLWYSDLYKYNFCTNKTSLIAKQIQPSSDWSSLDYILFVNPNDNKTYRVKSNGDSIKLFSNIKTSSLKWSPDGTKIIVNDAILDYNGNIINKLPSSIVTYQWESDSTLFYDLSSTKKDFEIYHYNLNTKVSKLLHKETLEGVFIDFSHFSAQQLKLYVYMQKKYGYDFIEFNVKTSERKLLGNYTESFSPVIVGSFENKLLAHYVMKDTLTPKSCAINYRSHIALMNFDGTNERQVLIPE